MRYSIPLSIIASAMLLTLAPVSSQAAVVGLHAAVPAEAHQSVITKAGWRWHRHRRCWWHHHRRYCRW